MKEIDNLGRAHAAGRRKAAVARVWIKPGDGTMIVNGKPHTEYFCGVNQRGDMIQPFFYTQTLGKFDVWCTVRGGGFSGQAQAIRLGIANALQKYEPLYRARLKAATMLQRDLRVVERKKPGRLKARKKSQWVKR